MLDMRNQIMQQLAQQFGRNPDIQQFGHKPDVQQINQNPDAQRIGRNPEVQVAQPPEAPQQPAQPTVPRQAPAGMAVIGSVTPFAGRTLDLSQKQDQQLYQGGKAPFAEAFNGDRTQLQVFQDNVSRRVDYLNCRNIFTMGSDNLLTHYGSIPAAQAYAAAAVRWANATYERQASYMVFTCILDSCTTEFRNQLQS